MNKWECGDCLSRLFTLDPRLAGPPPRFADPTRQYGQLATLGFWAMANPHCQRHSRTDSGAGGRLPLLSQRAAATRSTRHEQRSASTPRVAGQRGNRCLLIMLLVSDLLGL